MKITDLQNNQTTKLKTQSDFNTRLKEILNHENYEDDYDDFFDEGFNNDYLLAFNEKNEVIFFNKNDIKNKDKLKNIKGFYYVNPYFDYMQIKNNNINKNLSFLTEEESYDFVSKKDNAEINFLLTYAKIENKSSKIEKRLKQIKDRISLKPKILLDDNLTVETILSLGFYRVIKDGGLFLSNEIKNFKVYQIQYNFSDIKEEINKKLEILYINEDNDEKRNEYIKRILNVENTLEGLEIDSTVLATITDIEKHQKEEENNKLKAYKEDKLLYEKKNIVLEKFFKAYFDKIKKEILSDMHKDTNLKINKKFNNINYIKSIFFELTPYHIYLNKPKKYNDGNKIKKKQDKYIDPVSFNYNILKKASGAKIFFFYNENNDIIMISKRNIIDLYINKEEEFFTKNNIKGVIDVSLMKAKDRGEFFNLLTKNKNKINDLISHKDIKSSEIVLNEVKIKIDNFSPENILTLNSISSLSFEKEERDIIFNSSRSLQLDYEEENDYDFMCTIDNFATLSNNDKEHVRRDMKLINYSLFINEPDENKALSYLKKIEMINSPFFKFDKLESLVKLIEKRTPIIEEEKKLKESERKEKEDALKAEIKLEEDRRNCKENIKHLRSEEFHKAKQNLKK